MSILRSLILFVYNNNGGDIYSQVRSIIFYNINRQRTKDITLLLTHKHTRPFNHWTSFLAFFWAKRRCHLLNCYKSYRVRVHHQLETDLFFGAVLELGPIIESIMLTRKKPCFTHILLRSRVLQSFYKDDELYVLQVLISTQFQFESDMGQKKVETQNKCTICSLLRRTLQIST